MASVPQFRSVMQPQLDVELVPRMGRVPPHDHAFWEIALTIHGHAEHFTSRRRMVLSAGDVWVIRPGNWHTYMNIQELGVYKCKIGFSLFQELAPLLQRDAGALELFWRRPAQQAEDGCCYLRLNPAERIKAMQILQSLYDLQERKPPAEFIESLNTLWQFLTLLSRAVRSDKVLRTSAPQHRVAIAAMEYIEAHFSEALSVEDIATAVDISPTHLTRCFRQLTGETPMRYLNVVRVQHACLELSESDRPVSQIAAMVGWHDPNLFARRFRAMMGCSPREYRAGGVGAKT